VMPRTRTARSITRRAGSRRVPARTVIARRAGIAIAAPPSATSTETPPRPCNAPKSPPAIAKRPSRRGGTKRRRAQPAWPGTPPSISIGPRDTKPTLSDPAPLRGSDALLVFVAGAFEGTAQLFFELRVLGEDALGFPGERVEVEAAHSR